MINMFKHIFLFFVFGFAISFAQQPQHFTFTTNTGNNGIVSIPAIALPKANNTAIDIGDEIGVFSPQGLCVGAAVWTGANIGITIWGDNDRTPAIDGISYGERLGYKIWKKSNNIEYASYTVTYSNANPMYRFDGLYAPNAFYVITSLSVTGAPFPPSLTYPANGTTSLPNIFTFTWIKPEVATSYIFQVAADTFFTQLVINDTNVTTNSKNVTTLNKTTKYYWRVAAKNSIGNSPWSQTWSFTTITEVADRPTLVYPSNNSNSLPLSFVFSWNPSTRAQYYDIEIAFDEGFNMMLKIASGVKIPYYQIDKLSNYVKYYWRVRAFNESGYSEYSDVYNFTTIPLPPTGIAPMDGQRGVSIAPVFQWTEVPDAISYNLIVTTNPNDGSATIIYQNGIYGAQFSSSKNLINDKTYYWMISANMSGGSTQWSQAYSFKTKLSNPIPYNPSDEATGVPVLPTFGWGTVTNAAYYHFQLADASSDFSTPLIDLSNITSTGYMPITPLRSLSRYQWRIAAINADGESDWSMIQAFTTMLTAPDPPKLMAPANNILGLPLQPTLLWESLPSGITYSLQVSTDPINWSNPVVNRSGITTNFYQLTFDLQYYTNYYWRVAASNSVGIGAWSSPNQFTTRISNPYITSPQDGARAISTTPNIAWSPVSGATSYNLQISTSATNWGSPIVSKTGIINNNVDITTALNNSAAYYVRVTANSLGGQSDWSNAISFTTAMASAELLSPNGGAFGISLTPTLAWSSVPNATSYQLQISTNSDNWSAPTLDQVGITANLFTLSFTLQYHTTYYWRVRAINSSETSAWSIIRNFTTIISAPAITYPVDNSTWNDVIPQFVWSAVAGATGYTLQVGASNTDWSNPIINIEGIQGVTYLSPVQLANNTMYYWRMNANSAGGKSDWSIIKSFKTLPAYPSSVHLSTSITFPHYSSVSDYKASDYKLIGLPGASNIAMANMMPGTQKKNWDAYWDNGQSSNYMIEYDGSDVFKFSVGKAFWIISNSDLSINQTVSTSALNSQQEVEIPLHPGWNIITNPYATSINWQKVQLRNNFSDPCWKYDGKFESSSTIEPYEGYYFDNKNNLSILKIPYSLTESTIVNITENDKPQIDVNIRLSSSNKENGNINIGVSAKATKGIDDIDYKKPKAPAKIDNIAINNPAEPVNDYAADYRYFINDYEKWDFTVTSSANGQKALDAINISSIPAIYDVYLFDYSNQKKINLRTDSTYRFISKQETSKFSVLIGKSDAIEKEITVLTKPDRFEIMPNYPNPFNPETKIPVKIPNTGKVILAVYDILGKEVITLHNGLLESGTYTFEWKGKDKFGNVSPSGIYFVRMIGDNSQNSRKIMLVK